MTDWIEWNGGECPVDGDTLVNVKMRYDEENDPVWNVEMRASDFEWNYVMRKKFQDGLDIIAYRIVEDNHE